MQSYAKATTEALQVLKVGRNRTNRKAFARALRSGRHRKPFPTFFFSSPPDHVYFFSVPGMWRLGVKVVGMRRAALSSVKLCAPLTALRSSTAAAPSVPRWQSMAVVSSSRRGFATSQIVIPRAGESIVDGQLAKVMKKVGDRVAVDEVVAKLETEKVMIDVTSNTSGVVTEVKAKEGDTILIDAPLYIVDSDVAGAAPAASKSPATPAAPPAPAPPAAATTVAAAAPAASSSSAAHHSSAPHRQPMIRFTHGVRPQQQHHAGSASHSAAAEAPSAPRASYVAPNGTKIVFMDEGFYGNPFQVC
jgi:biotin carboxyl carrier protein